MDDVQIARTTVVPEIPTGSKTVVDPEATSHVVETEALAALHTKVAEVHFAQRQVCNLDAQIEKLKEDKRRLHMRIKAMDAAVNEEVYKEAAKFNIDVKDPQCPWTFNIDMGVFQKNNQ